MNRMRKEIQVNRMRFTRAAGVLCTVALLAGCASGGAPGDTSPAPGAVDGDALVIEGVEVADAELYAAAKDEGTIVLYTTASQSRSDALSAIFMEQTGIDLETVRLGGSKLTQRIAAEIAANKLGADVIAQSDKALALENVSAGALGQYCPPGAELIEESFTIGGCASLPLQITAMAFGANIAAAEEKDLPTSWKELVSKGQSGKIAIQSIGTGGSSWAVYLAIRKLYGVDFWKELAALDPVISDAASASQEAVVRGAQIIAPLVPPSNVGLAIEDGAPLKVIFPTDGTPAFANWTGIAANPPHPNAAKLYLNWVVSTAGQNAMASLGDYSGIPGSPAPQVVGVDSPPTIDELVLPEKWTEYVTEREAWNAEWNEIFGYTG